MRPFSLAIGCGVVTIVYMKGIDAILRAIHGASAETVMGWAKRIGG